MKVFTCLICWESKISCLRTTLASKYILQGTCYRRKLWICLLLATHTMKTRLNFTLHQNMSGIHYHSTLALLIWPIPQENDLGQGQLYSI